MPHPEPNIEAQLAENRAEIRSVASSVKSLADSVEKLADRMERQPKAGQWNMAQIVAAFTLVAAGYQLVDARFNKVENDRLGDQEMNLRLHARSVEERDDMKAEIRQDSKEVAVGLREEVVRNNGYGERIAHMEGFLQATGYQPKE